MGGGSGPISASVGRVFVGSIKHVRKSARAAWVEHKASGPRDRFRREQVDRLGVKPRAVRWIKGGAASKCKSLRKFVGARWLNVVVRRTAAPPARASRGGASSSRADRPRPWVACVRVCFVLFACSSPNPWFRQIDRLTSLRSITVHASQRPSIQSGFSQSRGVRHVSIHHRRILLARAVQPPWPTLACAAGHNHQPNHHHRLLDQDSSSTTTTTGSAAASASCCSSPSAAAWPAGPRASSSCLLLLRGRDGV